jgi:hypothetical protein
MMPNAALHQAGADTAVGAEGAHRRFLSRTANSSRVVVWIAIDETGRLYLLDVIHLGSNPQETVNVQNDNRQPARS